MRKKIRTADEEMRNVGYLILFSILWYSQILSSIARDGFHTTLLIFLAAGLKPLIQVFRMIQKAMYFRNFHRQCVNESRPQQGRIVKITREYYDDYQESRRYRRTYYFLIVETVDPETGIANTIKSEPYRIPVYKYLGSPYVQVYTDRTGWKHVIDGFQLKNSRSEPDIPLENSNVYLKDFNKTPSILNWIFIIIFVLILLQSFGVLK